MCKTSLPLLPSPNMNNLLTISTVYPKMLQKSVSLGIFIICLWHVAPLVVGFCWPPRPSGCSRPRPAPYFQRPLSKCPTSNCLRSAAAPGCPI